MQLAYAGDGVGHGRPLVGTVALDAREPQRQPAGILTARLDVVEGDLDDQLGAHVHRVPPVVAPDLELEQLLGLPREHLVRHRSEEHTSELQSLAYLVCRLLLEKKKKTNKQMMARRHRAELKCASM